MIFYAGSGSGKDISHVLQPLSARHVFVDLLGRYLEEDSLPSLSLRRKRNRVTSVALDHDVTPKEGAQAALDDATWSGKVNIAGCEHLDIWVGAFEIPVQLMVLDHDVPYPPAVHERVLAEDRHETALIGKKDVIDGDRYNPAFPSTAFKIFPDCSDRGPC